MDEKTYTRAELVEIMERQQLIYALDHAIQKAKQQGDSPQFVNPLINVLNALTAPPTPPEAKPSDNPEE
jgi:hypothetical protein